MVGAELKELKAPCCFVSSAFVASSWWGPPSGGEEVLPRPLHPLPVSERRVLSLTLVLLLLFCCRNAQTFKTLEEKMGTLKVKSEFKLKVLDYEINARASLKLILQTPECSAGVLVCQVGTGRSLRDIIVQFQGRFD